MPKIVTASPFNRWSNNVHKVHEINAYDQTEKKFPKYFGFGAATAAYQIEGAWNVDGKGPSVWDTLTHTHPEIVVDRATGDVAADSYHLYQEDIAALTAIGVSFTISLCDESKH